MQGTNRNRNRKLCLSQGPREHSLGPPPLAPGLAQKAKLDRVVLDTLYREKQTGLTSKQHKHYNNVGKHRADSIEQEATTVPEPSLPSLWWPQAWAGLCPHLPCTQPGQTHPLTPRRKPVPMGARQASPSGHRQVVSPVMAGQLLPRGRVSRKEAPPPLHP